MARSLSETMVFEMKESNGILPLSSCVIKGIVDLYNFPFQVSDSSLKNPDFIICKTDLSIMLYRFRILSPYCAVYKDLP